MVTKANLDEFSNCKTFPLRPVQHTSEEYAMLFQQGEEEALSFFYMDLHPALSLYAYHYVQNREAAEEVASDAFIKTWRHHEKLDSYNAIRAYLYKTVYNAAIYERDRMKRRSVIEKAAAASAISYDTPFDCIVRSETYHLLYSALKDLAPGNQNIIKMYFLDGKSSGEIAKELNLSRSTVNSHKYQGLAALRKKLLLLFSQFLP